MTSTTKKVLIGLLEPLIRTFGTSSSLVQVPALMVRRFIILSIVAVGSLAVLFTGLSLLLSGLLELSAIMGTTWVFSIVVGSLIALVGIGAMALALRREVWIRPVEDRRNLPPHPLETAALMAIDLIEEYQAQKKAQREEMSRMDESGLRNRTAPPTTPETGAPRQAGPDAGSWAVN